MPNGKKTNSGSNPTKKKAKPIQQKPTATADSTRYYADQVRTSQVRSDFHISKTEREKAAKKLKKDRENLSRQRYKGKPGYDKNGFPLKKN